MFSRLPRTYTYQISWTKATFFFVVTCVVSVFLFQQARTNDRGLIIDHFITLDVNQATLFWWGTLGLVVLAAASFVALMVGKVIVGPQQIVLTADSIELPCSPFRRKTQVIRYRDIKSVKWMKLKSLAGLGGTRFCSLRIRHAGGLAGLTSGSMRSRAEFEDLRKHLVEAIRVANQPAPRRQVHAIAV